MALAGTGDPSAGSVSAAAVVPGLRAARARPMTIGAAPEVPVGLARLVAAAWVARVPRAAVSPAAVWAVDARAAALAAVLSVVAAVSAEWVAAAVWAAAVAAAAERF